VAALLALTTGAAEAAEDPPYTLAREGFFYVGGKPVTINGHTYMAGQMYVDFRIPAQQTHLSHHHGAWRHPLRHYIFWNARWA